MPFMMKRSIVLMTLAAFVATLPVASAQAQLVLPSPGERVALSQPLNPPLLKGIKVFAHKPMSFDFILEDPSSSSLETTKLIKYFLAGLTVPEGDLWVNLSPYEKHRIVPEAFGKTEMGRDLLAQDYILKQITASVIYPESESGKQFWAKVYAKAQKKFGTTQVPVNTFNKVWIVPAQSEIYEGPMSNGQATAYITQAKLKVMLEEDYLALNKNNKSAWSPKGISSLGSQILREIVIPIIEQEVNEGANFAQLRQIYHSLILATWYKKKIKDSIIAAQYVNQNKINGLVHNPQLTPAQIYTQYLQSFKKGAYNFIKEELDPATGEMIPRKYFSGGAKFEMQLSRAMMAPIHPQSAQIVHMDVVVNEGIATVLDPANAAMVNYTPLIDKKRNDFLNETYKNETQQGHDQMMNRFTKDIAKANPYILQAKVEGLTKDVFKGLQLLQSGKEVHVLKSPQQIQGILKNDARRSMLGSLLLQGRANTPSIKLLNDKRFPKGSYVSRFVSEKNFSSSLVHTDVSQAFSAIFVGDVFLHKYDHMFQNIAFAGTIPVGIDLDAISLFEEFPDYEQYRWWFYWGFIRHWVVKFLFPMVSPSISKDEQWSPIMAWVDGNNRPKNVDEIKVRLGILREFLAKHSLGPAFQKMEALAAENLKKSIVSFKELKDEDIYNRIVQAGYSTDEVNTMAPYFQRNLRELGRDVNEICKIVFNQDFGLDDLDHAMLTSAAMSQFNLNNLQIVGVDAIRQRWLKKQKKYTENGEFTDQELVDMILPAVKDLTKRRQEIIDSVIKGFPLGNSSLVDRLNLFHLQLHGNRLFSNILSEHTERLMLRSRTDGIAELKQYGVLLNHLFGRYAGGLESNETILRNEMDVIFYYYILQLLSHISLHIWEKPDENLDALQEVLDQLNKDHNLILVEKSTSLSNIIASVFLEDPKGFVVYSDWVRLLNARNQEDVLITSLKAMAGHLLAHKSEKKVTVVRVHNSLDYYLMLKEMVILLELYDDSRRKPEIDEAFAMAWSVDPDALLPDQNFDLFKSIINEDYNFRNNKEIEVYLERYKSLMRTHAKQIHLGIENLNSMEQRYSPLQYVYLFVWDFIEEQIIFAFLGSTKTKPLSLEQSLTQLTGNSDEKYNRFKALIDQVDKNGSYSADFQTIAQIRLDTAQTDLEYVKSGLARIPSVPAFNSAMHVLQKGGIDLNPLAEQLETTGSGKFQFENKAMTSVRINDLTPVITSIEELTSLPVFLGIN